MKCIAAVVMMALVACSSASVSPLVYSTPLAYHGEHHASHLTYASPAITQYASIPESTLVASHYAAPSPVLAYSAHQSPLAYNHAPAALAYHHAPAALAYHHEPAHLTYHHAPAPVAYTAIHGEAKYTALNRGALHEAPLPGHTLSQTSLNLAPAAK